jgi:hypothetical protein
MAMIFTEANVAKILAGTKTQTRRIVKDGSDVPLQFDGKRQAIVHFSSAHIDAVARESRIIWEVGKDFAVQPGRGKRAVARITITAIRYCERAGDISEGDARAEGFATADDFRAVYARLNGTAALEQPCWCLEFSLAGAAQQPADRSADGDGSVRARGGA